MDTADPRLDRNRRGCGGAPAGQKTPARPNDILRRTTLALVVNESALGGSTVGSVC